MTTPCVAQAGLGSDAAELLLTLGIALIYYELNRPGSIVPGAVGLLLALLSLGSLARHGLNPVAATLILSAAALLMLGLARPITMPLSVLLSVAATVALIAGLRWLPAEGGCAAAHTPVALGCGVALGAGTSVLILIARRARKNKGVHKGLD